MVLYIHGIENDYSSDGFRVSVNRASDKFVCPVDALAVYMDLTEAEVPVHGPIFVPLTNPSQSLSVNLVSNILNHATQLAK